VKPAIVFMASLILCTGLVEATDSRSDSSISVVTLNKEQLGALSAAIRQMQRMGRGYKNQQVRISDKGNTFHVSFMEDPIDVRVAGDYNGSSWEIRKKDLKVVREILVR
jgi:hypothetical protein